MAPRAPRSKATAPSDLAVVPTTPPPPDAPPPVREFRVRRNKKQPIPIRLVIETVDEKGKDTEVIEEFLCRPRVAGSIILDVAASFTRDGSWQAAAIQRLLDAALPDDEKERWEKTMAHPDAPDLSDLGDIADYLCEQYGTRPTQSA